MATERTVFLRFRVGHESFRLAGLLARWGAAPVGLDYGRVVPTSRPSWVNRLDDLHLLTPLRILAIVVVAIIVAIVLRSIVTRVLSKTLGIPGTDRSRADARQRALSSALRSAVVGVVWGTAVITIISELGVNIGGVVATATVIGGAVAFGAQTLIRDVIAGLFVLAEDQYGVGDSVDLGYAAGEVERITLRSVRLRDGEGKVWHVAHGNVLCVANLSKSSVALLELELARDSDPAVVEEVVGRLLQQLRELPQVGPMLIGEPSLVGVTEVRDDRMVHRASYPTIPGKRDEVRRAWNRLALAAFREGELSPPPAPPTLAHFVASPSSASSDSGD
jgi:small-conductance mechanosensitive channel